MSDDPERPGGSEDATNAGGSEDVTNAGGSEDVGGARDAEDPPEWPVRESNTEYETGWYEGGYDLVEQPDGTEKRYYWAALSPAVVVVPVAGDEIVMVEQYRPAIRERHLELPAGIVEAGESYSEAGARELREETGFDPAGVSLIEDFQVATGVLRHRRGIVFAEGLEPVEVSRDSDEFLTVRTVPVEEALDVVRSDPAHDASIEGILLAQADGLL